MNDNPMYALVHSPLVGPLTWQLVSHEILKRGLEAVCPTLTDRSEASRPYWQQHAEAFTQSLASIPPDRPLVLVAHSGAGPLLPVLRQSVAHPVQAYVLVDAGIPRHNASRLELMRLQDPQWADQFHQELLQGIRFPTWDEEDLRDILPDADLRRKLAAEIHPRALPFFTEPIPVFPDWPDAPCAFIKFSTPYEWDFQQARLAGWVVREVTGGHFHMLVDPIAVTDGIVTLVQDLRSHKPPS